MIKIVEEALSYIEPISVSYLATCVDGQPYNRAMMLIYHRKKFYYATFSGDKKVEQITKNPRVEICVPIGSLDSEGSIRLRGRLEFVLDPNTRAEIHGCAGFIQGFWDDPQHPEFILMEMKPDYMEYMKPGTMEIAKVKLQS